MSDNHQSTIPAEVQQNRFDNSIGDAPKIAVTYRQIADLQPSPNNPRLHCTLLSKFDSLNEASVISDSIFLS